MNKINKQRPDPFGLSSDPFGLSPLACLDPFGLSTNSVLPFLACLYKNFSAE
jgi:hypothetical protein